MEALRYQYCCVSPKSTKELQFIVDNSREVTYRTFMKYADKEYMREFHNSCYAGSGLHISRDWAVSFHKSTLPNGKSVYYFRHSAIEYIFY